MTASLSDSQRGIPEAVECKDFGGSGVRSAGIEHEYTPPGIGSVRGSSLTVITFRGQADRAQRGLLNHYYFSGRRSCFQTSDVRRPTCQMAYVRCQMSDVSALPASAHYGRLHTTDLRTCTMLTIGHLLKGQYNGKQLDVGFLDKFIFPAKG